MNSVLFGKFLPPPFGRSFFSRLARGSSDSSSTPVSTLLDDRSFLFLFFVLVLVFHEVHRYHPFLQQCLIFVWRIALPSCVSVLIIITFIKFEKIVLVRL